MQSFGLIGYPLSHSFSKKYFEKKFIDEKINDSIFELFELSNLNELNFLIKSRANLKGLSVTIPYKKSIIPYLNYTNGIVNEINACNCIVLKNDKLYGYNTDVIGFEKSLIKDLKPNHTKALVLGDGGAAAAVKYVLKKLGIKFIVVNRNKKVDSILFEELNSELIIAHQIIINTTPLGTFPNVYSLPNIPYQYLTEQHYLFDVVYNPTTTMFMQKGLEKNAFVKNGLEMLQIQAEENWELWNA